MNFKFCFWYFLIVWLRAHYSASLRLSALMGKVGFCWGRLNERMHLVFPVQFLAYKQVLDKC